MSGVGLGAGLMYLLDPDRGNRRRARLRDKTIRGLHVGGHAADKAVRDLRNRARGAVAESWAALRNEPVDDAVLEQRIRAKLGRVVSHPNSIGVHAQDGKITLSGPVLAAEVDHLIREMCSVRGVHDIDNRLDVHQEPGNVPGLQGGRRRPGHEFELLQENWAPATRVLVGAAGALLLASGLWRRVLSVPFALLGGARPGGACRDHWSAMPGSSASTRPKAACEFTFDCATPPRRCTWPRAGSPAWRRS